MKIDHKDKGGHSKNENMLRYMHQSSTENLRSTATALTVQNINDNLSSTTITTTAPTSKWG